MCGANRTPFGSLQGSQPRDTDQAGRTVAHSTIAAAGVRGRLRSKQGLDLAGGLLQSHSSKDSCCFPEQRSCGIQLSSFTEVGGVNNAERKSIGESRSCARSIPCSDIGDRSQW